MPELPEVRTVKSGLEKIILNKKIINIDVFYENILYDISADDFKNRLINKTFLKINTFGKFLIFELDDLYLISHLRMEGKYYFYNQDKVVEKHEHIKFYFLDGSILIYHDVRKFGKMYVKNKNELYNTYPLNKLALEPFMIDLNVLLKNINSKKNLPIKQILLDQSVIAGIGNIYADEILYASKINPLKKGSFISYDEAVLIKENSIKILNKAISLGGTSLHTYNSLGIDGLFQNELLCHGNNDKCLICNTKINKIKISGRTSYYCPVCQKEV